jgi:hypothetical protein
LSREKERQGKGKTGTSVAYRRGVVNEFEQGSLKAEMQMDVSPACWKPMHAIRIAMPLADALLELVGSGASRGGLSGYGQ